ncbi:MAG: PEGA domain-containing protein [Bacteroidota bacterium]
MNSFRIASLAVLVLASWPLGAQGVLVVEPEPLGAFVVLDGERIGQGRVATTVDAGRYEVGVRYIGHRDATEAVEVVDGDTTRVRIALQRLTGRIEMVSVPDDARVFVNGERVAESVVLVGAGENNVRIERDGWKDVVGSIFAQPDSTVQAEYRTDIPSTRVIALSAFAPSGSVQVADGRPLVGAPLLVAETGALGTAIVGHLRVQSAAQDVEDARFVFNATQTQQARETLDEATERLDGARRQRAIGLGITAGLRLISFVDGFLNHSRRAGLVGPDPLRLRVRIDGDRPQVIATIPLP